VPDIRQEFVFIYPVQCPCINVQNIEATKRG